MSGKRAHVRSRARAWTLQLLYAWDVAGEGELRPHVRETIGHRRVSDRYMPYIERLVEALDEHMHEVDTALQETIPNWRLERLAVIDRNVLRIAAVELLEFEDVPGKVAIHEAIQLAEKYGSEDSPGFVNGVLDGLYKKQQDRENAHAG